MRTVPNLPEKVNILIARLSYNGYERVEIGTWLAQTEGVLNSHPRVNNLLHAPFQGYPTPCVRNQILVAAQKYGAHFAVMVDDDMIPDCNSAHCATKHTRLAQMADQKNFFPHVLDFMLAHNVPCVVGAPYCAGPPEERVLVTRFREFDENNANGPTEGVGLQGFAREEVYDRTGFEMVSALPTGLMMIDMRALAFLSPPWFEYEYETDVHDKLASTEDTVFSRNLCYMDVPQYCVWDSWAAHVKLKFVGRPRKYPLGAVPLAVQKTMREQIAREQREARPADRDNPAARKVLTGLAALEADPVVPLPQCD